jgi:dienelactone hydrolase
MDIITARVLRRPAAQVHGTLFVPAGAVPAAAVLVIGGSGGSEPSYVAEALARQGMTAMSVAYFARPGNCAASGWNTSPPRWKSSGPRCPRPHRRQR